MSIIGYVRVSTVEQGLSIEAQQEKIHLMGQLKGWTIQEIIADTASGKDLNRDGIQALLQRVKKRQVSTVIVSSLDRLTRSVRDLDEILRLFKKKGVSLVSIQESIDASNATGELLLQLVVMIAQWERARIGERTAEVLRGKRARGERYCGPVFTDADTVKRMREWREGEGLSFTQIATRLASLGVATARGGRWTASTVFKILGRVERLEVVGR